MTFPYIILLVNFYLFSLFVEVQTVVASDLELDHYTCTLKKELFSLAMSQKKKEWIRTYKIGVLPEKVRS